MLDAKMTHPERIFHYTSIDSLALILKSQKIRFSRLDGVDDSREAPTVHGIPFSKYFFVSCWTTERTESIPQWHLYTEKMTGVRIELPSYPFQDKLLEPPTSWIDVKSYGTLTAPINYNEIYGDSYMILPMCLNRDHFAGSVEYIDDVERKYNEAVTIELTSGNNGKLSIPLELVRMKMKHWEFQSEYRFSFFVLPSFPLPAEGPGAPDFYNNIANHCIQSLLKGRDPGVLFIDVDLKSSALSELVVTTGPLCSEGAKLCVESLVKEYAPLGRVQPSELEGSVRRPKVA